MITVRVYMTFNSERENELMTAIENLCTKIGQEEGIIRCNFFQNTKEPLESLLVEKWQSMQMVKEHVASKYIDVLAGAGVILSHDIRASLDKGETVRELNGEYMQRLSPRNKDI